MRPNQVIMPLPCIAKANSVRLLSLSPAFAFEEGVRTKTITGTSYMCVCEQNNFEKITVRTSEITPVVTNDDIVASTTPLYLSFEEFTGKFYYSDRTKNWELSCKAAKAIIQD